MNQKKKSGFEIGIYTLADIGPDPLTGYTVLVTENRTISKCGF